MSDTTIQPVTDRVAIENLKCGELIRLDGETYRVDQWPFRTVGGSWDAVLVKDGDITRRQHFRLFAAGTEFERAERHTGDTAETMTVTVRDHAAESPWGSGWTNPKVREVTISAFCPTCGGRRGEPQGSNQCDDGAYYWVQVWSNPCGHVDMYDAVIAEAARLAGQAVAR
jgi:hypothetical protein